MAVPHDLDWLGLQRTGDGRWSLDVTSQLGRGDGKLYGGTGIALATALLEAETDRHGLWVTVQFVGSVDVGARLDCRVDTLAAGRRTSQVRVTVTQGDQLAFTAVGSAGSHRPGAVDVQVPTMPPAPDPEDCPDLTEGWHPAGSPRQGWSEIADLRRVELPDGRFALWGRMLDHPHSRASLAFVADFVPVSVARAAGFVGSGISLDNSIRFGHFVDTDWALVEFDPWMAAGGYLHGGARIWSRDGTLLALASQTAAALAFPAPDATPG